MLTVGTIDGWTPGGTRGERSTTCGPQSSSDAQSPWPPLPASAQAQGSVGRPACYPPKSTSDRALCDHAPEALAANVFAHKARRCDHQRQRADSQHAQHIQQRQTMQQRRPIVVDGGQAQDGIRPL